MFHDIQCGVCVESCGRGLNVFVCACVGERAGVCVCVCIMEQAGMREGGNGRVCENEGTEESVCVC